MKLDPGLKEYVAREIIPRYSSFDKAHKEDHARSVIEEALSLAGHYDVDPDMVYAAAAFHDTGLVEGREVHHLVSGRIIREDPLLKEWFTSEQIETIAQGESLDDLLVEAFALVRESAKRTIGLEHYPELGKEEHWNRFVSHLHEKYYYGGYLKLFIPESRNAARLEELRQVIADEERLRSVFEEIFKEETQNK